MFKCYILNWTWFLVVKHPVKTCNNATIMTKCWLCKSHVAAAAQVRRCAAFTKEIIFLSPPFVTSNSRRVTTRWFLPWPLSSETHGRSWGRRRRRRRRSTDSGRTTGTTGRLRRGDCGTAYRGETNSSRWSAYCFVNAWSTNSYLNIQSLLATYCCQSFQRPNVKHFKVIFWHEMRLKNAWVCFFRLLKINNSRVFIHK